MPATNTNSAALVLPAPTDATNTPVTEEIADIRDIKGAVDISTGNEALFWLFGALALFVIIAIVVWFVRRQLAKRSVELAPPQPPPPHVVAWRQLQDALGLIHDAERFCTEVSLVVRVYLEGRFSLQAPDRTTEEFLFELQSSNRLVDDHKELLREFLGECDMVKFARAEPPETELRRLHESASRLVGETQPRLTKHGEEGGEQ